MKNAENLMNYSGKKKTRPKLTECWAIWQTALQQMVPQHTHHFGKQLLES